MIPEPPRTEDGDEIPCLSPTIGSILGEECPRLAHASHRLLGGGLPESDESLANKERGSILHNLVLEDGDRLEVLDYKDWRTAAAKAERVEVRASGMLPVLKGKLDTEFEPAAQAIRDELERLDIDLSDGMVEQRVYWQEPTEAGEVWCTAVLDWVQRDWLKWADLKTTLASVKPEACSATIHRSTAIYQHSAYTNACLAMNPEAAGRVEGGFIFAQSKAPFIVTPGHVDGATQAVSESKWQRAVMIWERCLMADEWPAYTDGWTTFHAPAWALSQAMEEEAREIGE